jgi:hypothetical protein
MTIAAITMTPRRIASSLSHTGLCVGPVRPAGVALGDTVGGALTAPRQADA